MEKNEQFLEKVTKKILNRIRTLELFQDFYDDDELINVNLYDCIAYLLFNEKDKIFKSEHEKEFLNLYFETDEENNIHFKLSELKRFLKLFDKYTISPELKNLLSKQYFTNENLIDLEYRIQLNSTTELEKQQFINEYEKSKQIIESIQSQLNKNNRSLKK